METIFENIINPDFGTIRQVYYNKFVDAFLIETEYGFQFILKGSKIIEKNINHQFKIIGNTFKKREVTFITQYGLHKSNIENLIVETTTDIWWVNTQYYSHQIINELNFPFFQYFSAHLKSIQNSNIILLADDFKGIVSYNVLTKEVEFCLDPKDKRISTTFNSYEVNEVYWLHVDKFEISEDEKYFYVISAYEGKSLFVFRTEDYSLIYQEIGSYALSFGLFEKDSFLIPSGYDFDADDKQPFKIVNLIDGSVDIICNTSDKLEDIIFGVKFQNLFLLCNRESNKQVYNFARNLLAIKVDDFINSNTLSKNEISIEPNIDLDITLDIFIQDNYLIASTWTNSISIHLITPKKEA